MVAVVVVESLRRPGQSPDSKQLTANCNRERKAGYVAGSVLYRSS
jgi:hypothetical protein